ncbi:MAG: hypothetical protein WC314_26110 [Vulcanimicrobiota bacterium]
MKSTSSSAATWGKSAVNQGPIEPELDLAQRRARQSATASQFGLGPAEAAAVAEAQAMMRRGAAQEGDDQSTRQAATREVSQAAQAESDNQLKGRAARQRNARYSSEADKKKAASGGKTKVRIYRAPKTQPQETEKLRDGGGSSSCSTCGTALPAAQAGNCPVCAQSGEDVILLTQTNYRFAGDRFFATADSVAATPEVKEIFSGETTLPLANLRYWPKIPGHRDILQVVREEQAAEP